MQTYSQKVGQWLPGDGGKEGRGTNEKYGLYRGTKKKTPGDEECVHCLTLTVLQMYTFVKCIKLYTLIVVCCMPIVVK